MKNHPEEPARPGPLPRRPAITPLKADTSGRSRDVRLDTAGLGLIAWSVISLLALVVLLGAIVGIAYANDAGIEATVADKECRTGPGGGGLFPSQAQNSVTVETKLFGIRHTLTDVPDSQCALIQKDNFVRYHVRSGRTILWEAEGGACIYDSKLGVRCGT